MNPKEKMDQTAESRRTSHEKKLHRPNCCLFHDIRSANRLRNLALGNPHVACFVKFVYFVQDNFERSRSIISVGIVKIKYADLVFESLEGLFETGSKLLWTEHSRFCRIYSVHKKQTNKAISRPICTQLKHKKYFVSTVDPFKSSFPRNFQISQLISVYEHYIGSKPLRNCRCHKTWKCQMLYAHGSR
jgi:hypothetical protein